MTGVSQICAKYTEQSAEYLETPYFEVSAHSGARDKAGAVFRGQAIRTGRERFTVSATGIFTRASIRFAVLALLMVWKVQTADTGGSRGWRVFLNGHTLKTSSSI